MQSVITSVLHYGDTLHSHAAHSTLKQLHAVYDCALRVITGDKHPPSVCTVLCEKGGGTKIITKISPQI